MRSRDEFEAAGLYDPATDASIGRLELLHWLDEEGFTLAEMVHGLATNNLGALAADRRLIPGERLSAADARAAVDLDEEEFDALATAFGFVAIGGEPEQAVTFTRTEAESFAVFGSISTMFSREEALGFVRVMASSIGRIAEASVALFLSDVEHRMLQDGVSEIEMAQAAHDAIGLLDNFAQRLDPILRRHVLQATERSRLAMINNDERFEFRYAIGFVDLVGFTEISGGMQPKELAEFIRDFEGRAHDVVTKVGARVVKLIGDEVMFVSTSPESACLAASALMSGFGTEDERVVPRGGLAYGNVLVRGGDYYGSIVNLASRLVDEAVPQELLVTEEAADAATGCRFDPAGRRMVKGFVDPITVRSFRE